MGQLQRSPGWRILQAPIGTQIVLGLVFVAALSSGLSLAGWIFDDLWLKGLGLTGRPMWPLSGVGFLFLSLGFWATHSWHRSAPYLLAIPLGIAIAVVAEILSGTQTGLGQWLFTEQVAAIQSNTPGRPVPTVIVTFAFLSVALLAVRHRSQASVEVANLLATATLCYGLFSTIPLLSMVARADPMARLFLAPLPGCIATLALSAAFLVWRHEAGWTLLLPGHRAERPLMGSMLPLIFILPVLPSIIGRWGTAPGLRAPVATEMLAVFCNVVIIGLLLWMSVNRITRQRAALRDVTLALDSAAIALTDQNGTITHWSRGCQELYKWTATQAVGRKKYELLRSRCEQAGSNALPKPADYNELEMVECRRDGSEINVIERRQLFPRGNQEPLVVLRMLDISERVRAETALRSSQVRFATAAEAYQMGVTEWDLATDTLAWTPGSEKRLGLEPGSVNTLDQWKALVHPDDERKVLDSILDAGRRGDSGTQMRYRLRLPSGEERIIEGSTRLFYDAHGTLIKTVGANIDVTDRVEREAALESRESEMRSIIDTVPDALVVVDEHGCIRTFSDAAQRMFGYGRAQVLGRNAKLLMATMANLPDSEVVEYLVDTRRYPHGTTREQTARRADGTVFPIELNVGEAIVGDERLFISVVRDVSDRHASEQRMTELSGELAHVSRQSAMSELAADLAHELNQPLSATANFLATARILIQRGEGGDRIAELLRMGEEQTLRSGEIIRRLRDFLSKHEVEMRPVSLDHTVREAVELVLFGAAKFDLKLSYQLDPMADMVFADRIQVQQVLANLLRNAVDALRSMPVELREITIISRNIDDNMIELTVSDSGPGLPEALREQLYSRFATTKKGTAMGIGLSISRRIIEAHGGTLVAENKPEGGAAFRFTLPALEDLVE